MDSDKVPPVKSGEFELSSDDRTWGMLSHLSYFLTFVIGVSCVAPLVIWILKRDSSEFVEDQAKEALNFQLSAFIVTLVLAATVCGIPLILVVFIMSIVYSIQAGMAANRGEYYRYPYTFRMIN
ncbi:MAG TPA: DUF4870 domain-containing protein [Pirellulaceae bacterium]|nr:DUF4870 domain-containing protein [Planctomycetales bacterium]HRX78533.1 DUF4870 domain-containing protein [Pirellulaceae bacterium]